MILEERHILVLSKQLGIRNLIVENHFYYRLITTINNKEVNVIDVIWVTTGISIVLGSYIKL